MLTILNNLEHDIRNDIYNTSAIHSNILYKMV